jgi:DNA-binding protein HU-beta
MTKTELINTLAEKLDGDRKNVRDFLEALESTVVSEMKAMGEVPLPGLGKFKVQQRKARMGRNPATGEPLSIPAKTVVKFTLAKAIKDILMK